MKIPNKRYVQGLLEQWAFEARMQKASSVTIEPHLYVAADIYGLFGRLEDTHIRTFAGVVFERDSR